MHNVVLCRPSYEYHSDITFTHSSFRHSSHQKEGERLLLSPPVSLRLVLNSNTPLPPFSGSQPFTLAAYTDISIIYSL
jgi:hypothetical protein